MVNSFFRIILAGLFLMSAAPVMAQEAAFDQPSAPFGGGSGLGTLPGQHPKQLQPLSSSPAQETRSNLRHWSRFSQNSAQPMFVRVPAGSKAATCGESHYIRPQCIQPGTVKQVAQAQSKSGAVRRYLAYNVPPGAFVRKATTSSNKIAIASKTSTTSSKKKLSSQTIILGYGNKPGEITYSIAPKSVSTATAISCYPRYH